MHTGAELEPRGQMSEGPSCVVSVWTSSPALHLLQLGSRVSSEQSAAQLVAGSCKHEGWARKTVGQLGMCWLLAVGPPLHASHAAAIAGKGNKRGPLS